MLYTCEISFHLVVRKLSWFQNIIVCLLSNSKWSPKGHLCSTVVSHRIWNQVHSPDSDLLETELLQTRKPQRFPDKLVSRLELRQQNKVRHKLICIKDSWTQFRDYLEALALQNCHNVLSNCLTHCLVFGERNTYLSEAQKRQFIAQFQDKRMKGQTTHNRLMF